MGEIVNVTEALLHFVGRLVRFIVRAEYAFENEIALESPRSTERNALNPLLILMHLRGRTHERDKTLVAMKRAKFYGPVAKHITFFKVPSVRSKSIVNNFFFIGPRLHLDHRVDPRSVVSIVFPTVQISQDRLTLSSCSKFINVSELRK